VPLPAPVAEGNGLVLFRPRMAGSRAGSSSQCATSSLGQMRRRDFQRAQGREGRGPELALIALGLLATAGAVYAACVFC